MQGTDTAGRQLTRLGSLLASSGQAATGWARQQRSRCFTTAAGRAGATHTSVSLPRDAMCQRARSPCLNVMLGVLQNR